MKYLLLFWFALGFVSLGQAAKPNVVILFTDDQGTVDANCYGSTDLITPNIDKLAATGVRFTQAYAHTVCCPARAALLTGRHPQRGGWHWTQGDMNSAKGINMALEEVTLAEALKPAGYRTALYGKWHLKASGLRPEEAGHEPLAFAMDSSTTTTITFCMGPGSTICTRAPPR